MDKIISYERFLSLAKTNGYHSGKIRGGDEAEMRGAYTFFIKKLEALVQESVCHALVAVDNDDRDTLRGSDLEGVARAVKMFKKK